MKIGLFDSGIGGLTVLKEIINLSPNHRFIYLADTANLPYGDKTDEQILTYADLKMNWMKRMVVDLVSIACNTTDSVIGNDLYRYKGYFKRGILNIIKPTALAIQKDQSIKKVGIMATEATVKRQAFENAFEKTSVDVRSVACPKLVPWIESEDVDYEVGYQLISEYMSKLFDFGIESLIYGCTHYKLAASIIEDVIRNNKKEIKYFDPAKFVAEEVRKLEFPAGEQSFEFYVTDISAKSRLENAVFKMLGIKSTVQVVSLQ